MGRRLSELARWGAVVAVGVWLVRLWRYPRQQRHRGDRAADQELAPPGNVRTLHRGGNEKVLGPSEAQAGDQRRGANKLILQSRLTMVVVMAMVLGFVVARPISQDVPFLLGLIGTFLWGYNWVPDTIRRDFLRHAAALYVGVVLVILTICIMYFIFAGYIEIVRLIITHSGEPTGSIADAIRAINSISRLALTVAIGLSIAMTLGRIIKDSIERFLPKIWLLTYLLSWLTVCCLLSSVFDLNDWSHVAVFAVIVVATTALILLRYSHLASVQRRVNLTLFAFLLSANGALFTLHYRSNLFTDLLLIIEILFVCGLLSGSLLDRPSFHWLAASAIVIIAFMLPTLVGIYLMPIILRGDRMAVLLTFLAATLLGVSAGRLFYYPAQEGTDSGPQRIQAGRRNGLWLLFVTWWLLGLISGTMLLWFLAWQGREDQFGLAAVAVGTFIAVGSGAGRMIIERSWSTMYPNAFRWRVIGGLFLRSLIVIASYVYLFYLLFIGCRYVFVGSTVQLPADIAAHGGLILIFLGLALVFGPFIGMATSVGYGVSLYIVAWMNQAQEGALMRLGWLLAGAGVLAVVIPWVGPL
jgi:hypothetical protein